MPIRFYIINVRDLRGLINNKRRSEIIIPRPTGWRIFLRGVLRLDPDLAFVRMNDELLQKFIKGEVLGNKLSDGKIKINNHIPFDVEDWTFWNLCKFCAEGIQYGTFQRFLLWKW